MTINSLSSTDLPPTLTPVSHAAVSLGSDSNFYVAFPEVQGPPGASPAFTSGVYLLSPEVCQAYTKARQDMHQRLITNVHNKEKPHTPVQVSVDTLLAKLLS